MQKFAGTCSPEQLHTLQKIFDRIWMELRSSRASNYSGPTDPEALRDELARRLLSQYTRDTANADDITAAILRSFGIEAHGIKQTHVAEKAEIR